jgi:PPOX class probable F420-dependent enzyme
MSTPFDKTPYISLRSFKRDGGPVDTPVWCAPLDGKLVLFTLRESFKVKRIARNPRVQVAACTINGKLLGPWHEGSCHAVEDPAHASRAYAALTRKYGMTMRIGNVLSTLSGRIKRRLVMEIAVAPEASAS